MDFLPTASNERESDPAHDAAPESFAMADSSTHNAVADWRYFQNIDIASNDASV